MNLEQAAQRAAGNWRDFDSFIWWRESEIADPENWAIIYTSNRDSGLLGQSNAAAIGAAMMPYTEGDDPDVVFEEHSHWAVGHVNGFSIRVFRDGVITEAFRTYWELHEAMQGYPVLDEEDYSRREYEATIENIGESAYRLRREYELPPKWREEVFSWLWDNNQRELENVDDQGGWPSEEALEAAFNALGYEREVADV
jgi:hypothetical protein